MSGYWSAHSDRDWQDECGMYEPEPDEELDELHTVADELRHELRLLPLSDYPSVICIRDLLTANLADVEKAIEMKERAR